ncbi:MAG: hypothetical protein FWF51_11500 [Chitinivibrionia bacterium]|nr:hypothetical protein [Chitinivibrionia bacterium]
MNLKTIKLLLPVGLAIALTFSCNKENEENIEVPGNKKCYYNNIDAYMVIDSILSNVVYFSVFSKSDDKELLIEPWNPSKRWESLLNANCVSSNLFLIGDTLSCRVDTIISGTCDPIILNSLGYSECLNFE